MAAKKKPTNKQPAKKEIMGMPTRELFAQGHRGCAGCGAAIIARHTAKIAGPDTIIVNATGCLEVFTTPYPETSWKVPWIHGAFENAAAIASGIEMALIKQGKRNNTNLIVMGGDGGTFDIGFGAISGAFERGHKMTYICYDNEAYMNTGVQRSGATPKYSSTTTSPAGKKIHGKQQFAKPLPFILAAHGAYVATANLAFLADYKKKLEKALKFNGPSYIQIFSSCPTGWKHRTDMSIEVAKLAHQTRVYPLYEIENGMLRFSMKVPKPKQLKEYYALQGRFKHLSDKEIAQMQKHVNENYEKLLELEKCGVRFC